MDRTHNMGLAPCAPALNTIARPSGESAKDGTLSVVLDAAEKMVLSGGNTGKLIGSANEDVVDGRAARNAATTSSSAAATQPLHSRVRERGVTSAPVLPGSSSTSSM